MSTDYPSSGFRAILKPLSKIADLALKIAGGYYILYVSSVYSNKGGRQIAQAIRPITYK